MISSLYLTYAVPCGSPVTNVTNDHASLHNKVDRRTETRIAPRQQQEPSGCRCNLLQPCHVPPTSLPEDIRLLLNSPGRKPVKLVLTVGRFPVQTANSHENAPHTTELFGFEVFSAVELRVTTQYSLVNGYKSLGEPTASTLDRNEIMRNIIFKKAAIRMVKHR